MAAANGNNHKAADHPDENSDFEDDWQRELNSYWNGPYLSRSCWQVVRMSPGVPPKALLDLGDNIPDLRYTQYRVIRIYEGEVEAEIDGTLMEFYPVEVKGGEEDHAGFTPATFKVGLFRHSMVQRLGLEGTSWVLWMKIDHADVMAFKVDHGGNLDCDQKVDESFRNALELFESNYLREDHMAYFALTFLVYVDDEETHQKFLKQYDPKHETCKTSNIPCSVCGTSPHSPTTPNGPRTPSKLGPDTPSDGSSFNQSWTWPSDLSGGTPDTTVNSIPNEDSITPLQPGLLASLDTETKKGDVLDGDMDAILPVTETPYLDEWDTCCSLLKLNPVEHMDPLLRSIKIPYTDICLSPRQFRTAFWMLSSKQARKIEGGILADVPGTGKTYTCLAVVLLRALIAYNMAEVKREWSQREYDDKKGSGGMREFQHFPRGYVSRGDDACPCGDKQGIVCFANPDSQTRLIGEYLNRGVTLIQVPSGVIEEWKKVMSNGKLHRKYFEPCAFHTSVPRDLQPPPNFRSRFDVTPFPRRKDYPEKYKPGLLDFDFHYVVPDEPGKAPERYIILTTHQADKLSQEFEYPVSLVIGGKRCRKPVYALPVGCQMVDEFHAVRGVNNPVVQMARGHSQIKKMKFDFWAVTGTPLQFNIMDLESIVDLLYCPTWNDKNHYHNNKTEHALKVLQEAYQHAVAADASPLEVEDFKQMSRRFFDGLIIRHTMDSRFFDKPITTIEEVKAKKVSMSSADYTLYKDDIQEIANQVNEKICAQTGMENGYEQVVRSLKTYNELAPLQMLSTFPGAAKVIKKSHLRCDRAWLREIMTKKDNGDNRDPANMPLFFVQTDDIIKDSPVLDRIWYWFQNMELDPQSRPKADASGKAYALRDDRRTKKMVIITPTLAEAIFVYLGMLKKLEQAGKSVKVVMLHGDMKSSAKQAMTTDFQSLTPRSARILVTPFDVGGTGINLQTANYQVLTGPLRTKELEKQAFARTNREGQQLRLHHYLFLDDDNPAHRLICARQAARKVAGNPFDMGVPLELENEDGA